MKARITLTVDPKVSHRAKDVARRQGISLSALVEKLLSESSGSLHRTPRAPFSLRWKGKMQLAAPPDERAKRLHAKYNLTNHDAPLS